MTLAKPIFERSMLTDWLITQLLDPKLPADKMQIGRGVAPPAGGWTGGQPGEGDFVPYVVVGASAATPLGRQTIAHSEAQDWLVRYTMKSVGGVHDMADWTADQVRQAWDTQPEVRIPLSHDTPPANWKGYQFSISQMGAVTRNDDVSPPYWEVDDILVLSLTRCRS